MAIRVTSPVIEAREKETEDGRKYTEYCVCVEVYNSGEDPVEVSVDFIVRLQDTATPPGPNRNYPLCETQSEEIPARREIRRGNASVTMDGYKKICCCELTVDDINKIQTWSGAILVFVTNEETGEGHHQTLEREQVRIPPRSRERKVSRNEKVKFGAWLGFGIEETGLVLGGAVDLPKGWNLILDESTQETLPVRVTGTLTVGANATAGDKATVVLELISPKKHVPDDIREYHYLEFLASGVRKVGLEKRHPRRKKSRTARR